MSLLQNVYINVELQPSTGAPLMQRRLETLAQALHMLENLSPFQGLLSAMGSCCMNRKLVSLGWGSGKEVEVSRIQAGDPYVWIWKT